MVLKCKVEKDDYFFQHLTIFHFTDKHRQGILDEMYSGFHYLEQMKPR